MPGILKNAVKFINNYISMFVAFGIVAIIGIIIIPLRSQMLDILLVLNISLAVVILVLTLFTRSVLEFSTFPTLLLITTMFRLALNISSTRLILSDGNAGDVINAFGTFVTGGNYIVGAVIFVIITVVQMVVVTSGASRVSEVSARFTLDAMPGKQMAIDADLNSGIIDENTAKKRRMDLQREADFYGAMDGASKFVKGDAIAGIIITIINLLGGILIFGMQNGLGAVEALNHFGKLTIGDGLVSQIPSLLISVASAVLVTRSDDGQGFGETVTSQLFSFSKVIMIAAVVMLIISIVPAFPTFPFLIMSVLLGALSYLLMENEKAQQEMAITTSMSEKREVKKEEGVMSFQVEPISIEIGYGLIPIVDEGSDDNLINHITAIRKQCAQEMGIVIHPIRIRDNLQLGPNEYVIKIKGNKIAGGDIYINKYLVIDPGSSDFNMRGIPTKEPAFGLDAIWIDEKDKDKAEMNGYTVVEPVVVLVTHLKEVIKSHSSELIGRQEVKELLEGIKEKYNVVVDELIPDILSLGEVQKVLQNLLKERVPVYDLVTILENLADNGVRTKDIEVLTEHVRYALRRTIVKNFVQDDGVLKVVTLHPSIEQLIENNVQKSISGSIPVLQPEVATRIFDNVKATTDKLLRNGIEAVILTSPKIRVAFKNLISMTFPHLTVLSLNEIPNDIEIQSVGQVERV